MARDCRSARVLQVPAPGPRHVQRGVHAGGTRRQSTDCGNARGAVQRAASTRLGRSSRRTKGMRQSHQLDTSLEVMTRIEAALDEVANLDEDRILRSYLGLIRATLRTNYFQCGTGRRAEAVRLVQARSAPDSRASRTPAEVRDIRVFATRRRCAPARRIGRARGDSLVGPPRGLSDRGAGAGEGADGEERGHRTGRLEGGVRPQGDARRRWPAGDCRKRASPATGSSSAGCST